MLLPRNVQAKVDRVDRDVNRVKTLLSDYRQLGYFTGETIDNGYSAVANVTIDGDYQQVFSSPFIGLIAQHLPHCGATAAQTWIVDLVQDLLLLTRVTDYQGLMQRVIQLADNLEMAAFSENDSVNVLRQLLYCVSQHEPAVAMTAYLQQELAESGRAERVALINNALSAMFDLGMTLQTPDSEGAPHSAPHSASQNLVSRPVLLDGELRSVQEVVGVYCRIGATLQQLLECDKDSPREYYAEVLKPFLKALAKKKMLARPLSVAYISTAIKTLLPLLDAEEDQHGINEIYMALLACTYMLKLEAFKSNDFSRVISVALASCLESEFDVRDMLLALYSADFNSGYHYFSKDMPRGVAFYDRKFYGEMFQRASQAIAYRVGDTHRYQHDVLDYCRNQGMRLFTDVLTTLVQFDEFDSEIAQQAVFVQALAPYELVPTECDNEHERFFSTLRAFVVQARFAHSALQATSVETQTADRCLEQLSALLDADEINYSALHDSLVAYFAKARRQIVADFVRPVVNNPLPGRVKLFFQKTFLLMANSPESKLLNAYLYTVLFSTLEHLLNHEQLSVALTHDVVTRVLLGESLATVETCHQRGYYPTLGPALIDLLYTDVSIAELMQVLMAHSFDAVQISQANQSGLSVDGKKRLADIWQSLSLGRISSQLRIGYRFDKSLLDKFLLTQLGVSDPLLQSYLPLRTHQGYIPLAFMSTSNLTAETQVEFTPSRAHWEHIPRCMPLGNADTFNCRLASQNSYEVMATFNTNCMTYAERIVDRPGLPALCMHSRYGVYAGHQASGLAYKYTDLAMKIQSNVTYISDAELYQQFLVHSVEKTILAKILRQDYLSFYDLHLLDEYTFEHLDLARNRIVMHQPVPQAVLLILAWRKPHYLRQILSSPQLSRQLFMVHSTSELILTLQAGSTQTATTDSLAKQEFLPNLLALLARRYRHTAAGFDDVSALLAPLQALLTEFQNSDVHALIRAAQGGSPHSLTRENFAKALISHLPEPQQIESVAQDHQKVFAQDVEFLLSLMLSHQDVAMAVISHYAFTPYFDFVRLFERWPELWLQASSPRRISGSIFRAPLRLQVPSEQLMKLLTTSQHTSIIRDICSRDDVLVKLYAPFDALSGSDFLSLYQALPLAVRSQVHTNPAGLAKYLAQRDLNDLCWVIDHPLTAETLDVFQRHFDNITIDEASCTLVADVLLEKLSSADPSENALVMQLTFSAPLRVILFQDEAFLTAFSHVLASATGEEQAVSTAASSSASSVVPSSGVLQVPRLQALKQELAAFVQQRLAARQTLSVACIEHYHTLLTTEYAQWLPRVEMPWRQFPSLYEALSLQQCSASAYSTQQYYAFNVERMIYSFIPSATRDQADLQARWHGDEAWRARILQHATADQTLLLGIQFQQHFPARYGVNLGGYGELFATNLFAHPQHHDQLPGVAEAMIASRIGDYARVIAHVTTLRDFYAEQETLHKALWLPYLCAAKPDTFAVLRVLNQLALLHPQQYAQQTLRVLIINNSSVIDSLSLDDSLSAERASVCVDFLVRECRLQAQNVLTQTLLMDENVAKITYALLQVSTGPAHLSAFESWAHLAAVRPVVLETVLRYPTLQIQLALAATDYIAPKYGVLQSIFSDDDLGFDLCRRFACHAPELLRDSSFSAAAVTYVLAHQAELNQADRYGILQHVDVYGAERLLQNDVFRSSLLQYPQSWSNLDLLEKISAYPELVALIMNFYVDREAEFMQWQNAIQVNDIKAVVSVLQGIQATWHKHRDEPFAENYTVLFKRFVDEHNCDLFVSELMLPENTVSALEFLQLTMPGSDAVEIVQERLLSHPDFSVMLRGATSRDWLNMLLNPNLEMHRLLPSLDTDACSIKLLNLDNLDLLDELFQSPRFYLLMNSSVGPRLARAILQPKILLLPTVTEAWMRAMTLAVTVLRAEEMDALPYAQEIKQTLYTYCEELLTVHFNELARSFVLSPEDPQMLVYQTRLFMALLQGAYGQASLTEIHDLVRLGQMVLGQCLQFFLADHSLTASHRAQASSSAAAGSASHEPRHSSAMSPLSLARDFLGFVRVVQALDSSWQSSLALFCEHYQVELARLFTPTLAQTWLLWCESLNDFAAIDQVEEIRIAVILACNTQGLSALRDTELYDIVRNPRLDFAQLISIVQQPDLLRRLQDYDAGLDVIWGRATPLLEGIIHGVCQHHYASGDAKLLSQLEDYLALLSVLGDCEGQSNQRGLQCQRLLSECVSSEVLSRAWQHRSVSMLESVYRQFSQVEHLNSLLARRLAMFLLSRDDVSSKITLYRSTFLSSLALSAVDADGLEALFSRDGFNTALVRQATLREAVLQAAVDNPEPFTAHTGVLATLHERDFDGSEGLLRAEDARRSSGL
jgi:hypothetical protein